MEIIEDALMETTADIITSGFDLWKLSEWLNKHIIVPFAELITKYPWIIIIVLISAPFLTKYIKRKR